MDNKLDPCLDAERHGLTTQSRAVSFQAGTSSDDPCPHCGKVVPDTKYCINCTGELKERGVGMAVGHGQPDGGKSVVAHS